MHLEHQPAWSIPPRFPPFDAAVFAGDVGGSPAESVAVLAGAHGLKGRPIVFVPGNHEYYGDILQERLEAGRAACANTNVSLLDREAAVIGGVRFVGATLWTDYKLLGDPLTGQIACLQALNDHRLIGTADAGKVRRFLPGHALARHEAGAGRDRGDGLPPCSEACRPSSVRAGAYYGGADEMDDGRFEATA